MSLCGWYGGDKQQKTVAFNIMTDPRVAPFVDMETVVNDFVIEEYGGDDPDKFKAKGQVNSMLGAVMGTGGAPGGPQSVPGGSVGVVAPPPLPMNQPMR